MNKFWRSFVQLSLLFFIANYAGAACLQNGSLRFSEMKKIKTIKEPYCFEEESAYIASWSCEQNGKCLALQRHQVSRSTMKIGSIGNPSHLYCRGFSGEPQFVEYWNGKNWRSTAICRFNDRSFVGIDYLTRYLIDFVN